MRKRIPMIAAALAAGAALAFPLAASAGGGVDMHRLYNPNSGEHFYTASAGERDSLVSAGWFYEGVGWTAPEAGDPVHRLYNPNVGEHHYTLSDAESSTLVSAGWSYEGVGWRSDPDGAPVYREYNPNAFANNHNYTADPDEHGRLLQSGWTDEGVGWRAASAGGSAQDGADTPESSGGASEGSAGGAQTRTEPSEPAADASPQPARQQDAPSHVHEWAEVTESRTVVDEEAWDEPVTCPVYHCQCGYEVHWLDYYTPEEGKEWQEWVAAHEGDQDAILEHNKSNKAAAVWDKHVGDNIGNPGHTRSSIRYEYGYIHHPEVSHVETSTSYVCRGCGAERG